MIYLTNEQIKMTFNDLAHHQNFPQIIAERWYDKFLTLCNINWKKNIFFIILDEYKGNVFRALRKFENEDFNF